MGVARDVIFASCMTVLTPDQLHDVRGGAETLGRCGPGSGWSWLGNVYTAECKAHDQAVRQHVSNGSSYLGAQVRALPLLPAAVGSYVRERFK